MPEDTRARQRAGTGLGLLLALVLAAVLLTALPGDDREGGGGCAPRTVAGWSADERLTAAFARYGDDAARTDDWTGGDGTHSVELPDGRVLWLFSDTYLGRVHGPPNPVGESSAWRDATAPLFPDPGPQQWRWPVAARVEPRSPGAAEQVPRVLLWVRAAGQPPWVFGVPVATEVATLSLPALRVESVVRVLDQGLVADPARRVLFGTAAVSADGWTYVFGGDDRQAAGGPVSYAHVARVPEGRLAEPGAWRYWDGRGWTARGPSRAVLGDGRRTGVGSAFSVVRHDGTYVLFTMAAGPSGLTSVTSYWACSPDGPWHGPARAFTAPLPRADGVAAYNPRVHPALSRAGKLVVSYDVNWLETTGAAARLSRNVSLYRPRFVTLRLAAPD